MRTTLRNACGWVIAGLSSAAVTTSACIASAKSPPVQTEISSVARGSLPADVTTETIELGRGMFNGRGNCSQCHGRNGGGTFLGPALNDDRHIHLQTASFDEIIARIRAGVPQPKKYSVAMPPLGGASLTEKDARAVAAYVFSIDRSR